MNRTHPSPVTGTLLLLTLLVLLPAAARGGGGPLGFLEAHDPSQAWVVDSGFDPLAVYGLALDPPWQVGLDALTRVDVDLAGPEPELLSTPPLGAGGWLMSFALSPDGDTAVASTLGPNGLLVVRGLRQGEPAVDAVLPMERFPLSLDVSPDGRTAVAGLQLGGPGTAQVAVIAGLPEAPFVEEIVDLGIAAEVLGAVESVDFGRDGRRVLVQTALHRHPAPPLFFLPDVVLQVVELGPGAARVSEPLVLPPQPFLPPGPPFEGLATGRALGDSAILCDGDTAVVGSTGALNLFQPDARVLLVRGVRSGALRVERVLTLAEGVGIAPFQVTVAPDCSAWITNTFDASVTRIGGLLSGDLGAVELESHSTVYPFPAEPALTPDGARLLVHHPRTPANGVPPPAVTVLDARTGAVLGPPLGGPVVAWAEVKDGTLATVEPGLVDHLRALGRSGHGPTTERLVGLVRRAVALAAEGRPAAARAQLTAFLAQVDSLAARGVLGPVEAWLYHDLAGAGLQALP